jgi:flagellar biosynthetic protein FliP
MLIVQTIAALGVTVGALMVGVKLLRAWRGGMSGHSPFPVHLLSRVSYGPRQSIGLLRVGGRVLVVSLSESGASLLTELSGSELDDALATAEPTPLNAALGKRLPSLARFSLLGCLALLLTVGRPAEGRAAPLVQQDTTTVDMVAPTFELEVGDDGDGLRISGAVGVVVLMTVMTLLPALFLMMTSFTRILIVLHFLRAALGTQTTPPGQLLVAIAVMLTGVVMAPALEEANTTALQPYLDGELTQVEAYKAAVVPFRRFMLANTPEEELSVFAELSRLTDVQSVDDIPTVTVMSSFVTSELKAAFKIGFLLFLPFTVIDLVVASVLMSMGMFMLPPVMISLPFKLLLFVLADGWTLVTQSLVASFR